MSLTASSTLRQPQSFFGNFMNTLDRLLLAWHEISTRNGDVPRLGLKTPFRGAPLQRVAMTLTELARDGLRRRARHDSAGQDETHFIAPLVDIAQSGMTPGERLVEDYETRWNRRIEPVFT